MYKFIVWTTAISLAPASMTGLLLNANKQASRADLSPEPIHGSTAAMPVEKAGSGGLQDRKVITTGTEVWQGIERRSTGRRAPDALHNALYITGGCQAECATELSHADKLGRPHDTITF